MINRVSRERLRRGGCRAQERVPMARVTPLTSRQAIYAPITRAGYLMITCCRGTTSFCLPNLTTRILAQLFCCSAYASLRCQFTTGKDARRELVLGITQSPSSSEVE